jgi:hypothetical protein
LAAFPLPDKSVTDGFTNLNRLKHFKISPIVYPFMAKCLLGSLTFGRLLQRCIFTPYLPGNKKINFGHFFSLFASIFIFIGAKSFFQLAI